MVRTRTLITFATAAVVPTLSHATATNPTFQCSSDPAAPSTLKSIDWGDLSSTSSIIIVTDAGAQTAGPSFGCSDGTPSAFISGGDSFNILFTPPSSGSGEWLGGAKLGEKDFTEDIAGQKWDVALFDDVLQSSDKSFPDNFLGIQMKWRDGEVNPGPQNFSIDSSGNLVLDPGIPQSGVTVSFYSTPQVPEPASLLLLGAGMAGLGGLWRKKKR